MKTQVRKKRECAFCQTTEGKSVSIQVLHNVPICQQCVKSCPRCGNPMTPHNKVCRQCQSMVKQFVNENQDPLYHEAIDASDTQRHVPRSPVTGKPYSRDAGTSDYDEEPQP